MIISFTGHSYVRLSERIKEIVKGQIRNNIRGADFATCYFGGYGGFDEICACACRELKREGEKIELIYVTPYINLSEQKKIKEMQQMRLYDASIYPPIENVPLRFAILKRNEWMMTNADMIIAYVENCTGGAYKSLQIAKQKKKKIINICDFIGY